MKEFAFGRQFCHCYTMLTQPHDALFKWTFSQREHAAALLKAALPPALRDAADWTTLRLLKGSFVDKALRERHSDLLYSVEVAGQPLLVYTLIEHQRKVQALMALRMLAYMTRIWDRHGQSHPAAVQVPPIWAMVLHHSETGWTAATAFEEIVTGQGAVREALEPFIPHFRFQLVDLSGGQVVALVEQTLTALAEVVLWSLSVAGDDPRLEREIGRFAAALDQVLQAPDGLDAFEALLRYLLATHERMGADKLRKLMVQAVGPRAQEGVVTLLDEIERKGERRGERKGKREGKREGRAQTLLDLLAARFGKVSVEVAARVKAADEASLARWAVRVLTAPTIEEVLESGPRAPSPRSSPRRTAPSRERAPRAPARGRT
jgi:hypothetical protein